METQKKVKLEQNEARTPRQSDNNNGTLGKEGGLPYRREQKPFDLQDNPEDIVTGNKEYDRHHKAERDHQKIRVVTSEEERKKGEINNDLPGNRPDNRMTNHAEETGGITAED